MNPQKVREIIQLYKEHFPRVHREEIYKWRIVKRFQDRWNVEAVDFYPMLEDALHTSQNLLASGNYFASRMLLENAQRDPETVRGLFQDLYDEEQDLLTRLSKFRERFKVINARNYPGSKDYQDHRALMVYLSLRYPNVYYLYKFRMFRDFCELVDYPFRPIQGRMENVTQYLTLCNLLNEEIAMDYELLELHHTRIGDTEFADPSYHILTQDVIYASTFHFPKFKISEKQAPASFRLKKVNRTLGVVMKDDPDLKGSFTNYLDLEREKKRVGDLGELLVFELEQERLRTLGIRREPEHKSKSEGDGLGYDILSYNDEGTEIFIEVKTTTAGIDQPFFVTRNELKRSIQDSDRFALYRLYDFDIPTMTAKYYVWLGELTQFCINPVLFRIVLTD
jgi:hypothetical protein